MTTRNRNRKTAAATTAPATAAPTGDEKTEQSFDDLFMAAAADATADIAPVVDAYRGIHGSARGNRLSRAMAAAMGAGHDADRVVALFDACNTRPVAERVQVDPRAILANQLAALDAVAAQLLTAADADRATLPAADADAVAAITARVAAAATRGQTRGTRATGGTFGSRGAQHVTAWIVANATDLTTGEIVPVGKIAGRQGQVCNVPGSPYQGGPNPSVGAIGNVLTGPKNDDPRTGAGWAGNTSPRGVVIDLDTLPNE